MKKQIVKRLIALTLSALLVTSATGCGKQPPKETQEAQEEVAEDSGDAAQGDEALPEENSGQKAEEEVVEEEAEESLVTGENLLTNGDFSSGIDPWSYFCQDGLCTLGKNEDGELDADIKSIGTVAHGVQLYHDGFTLYEGCKYKLTFDGHCDIERDLELRFQINGGDYHAYFQDNVPVGPEKQSYEYHFTMFETTDPAPRMCFNMGLVNGLDQSTAEHHVYLDNFVLTVEDDSERVAGSGEVQMPDIAVNQIGYLPGAYKSATLRKSALNQTAKLINEDTGKSVLEVEIAGGIADPDTGDKEVAFDFSEIKDEGNYHIEAGEAVSPSFRIAGDVYKDVFKALIKMLYYQRCGMELTVEYAEGFAHSACHAEEAVLYEDKTRKLDVSGGWHDAGDYGRYSVAGAKAAADLLLAYENYPDVFGDDIEIPESGNGIPDVLDEAKYELDWLLKMQADNGGVYHKVTCSNFPGEVMPQNETDPLIIMPISTTATGDFAGVMAIAARVYADIDKAYADKCLEAAKKAAQYLDKTPSDKIGYKNPNDVSTGEYEDDYDLDERYWAYAELYKTTGDKAYEKSMSEWIPNNGLSLGWQGVAGYGAYAYLSSKDTDSELFDRFKNSANNLAEVLIKKTNMYPYGSSIVGDYPWGSNLTIANNAMLVLMLKDYVEIDKSVADKQLNYLFGNNANGYSFVTGYGTTYPDHPHHRPSQALGTTVPGMVVGGPSNSLGDPYAANVLKGVPVAKCYVDNAQSYSTNEITIYWNSPVIYLLAGEIAETK